MDKKKQIQEIENTGVCLQYRISLFCGNHGSDIKNPMVIDEETGIIYCEKDDCKNCLSKEARQHLTQEIHKRVYKKNSFFESNLTGMRWRDHGIDYAILKHKNDQIQILVLNHNKTKDKGVLS